MSDGRSRGSPRGTNKWRDLGDVGTVGLEFVLALLVGYYGGRWLDGRFFGGHGWMTGVGTVVGVLTAFKAIYDASKRARWRLEELEREESLERARRDAERREHVGDDDH